MSFWKRKSRTRNSIQGWKGTFEKTQGLTKMLRRKAGKTGELVTTLWNFNIQSTRVPERERK